MLQDRGLKSKESLQYLTNHVPTMYSLLNTQLKYRIRPIEKISTLRVHKKAVRERQREVGLVPEIPRPRFPGELAIFCSPNPRGNIFGKIRGIFPVVHCF